MPEIVPSYDRTTIALHCATAAMVVLLWVLGQTADWFPDQGLMNTTLWSIHVVTGFALAVVLAWRIAWRLSGGRRLPPAGPAALHAAAKVTHYGLYLLLVAVVVLGVVNAFVRGYSIFGLFHLPQIGDRAWRRPITEWHGLVANIILAVAALHAAAAILHRRIAGTEVISRMVPRDRLPQSAPVTVEPRRS